jgi:hypothetical protein
LEHDESKRQDAAVAAFRSRLRQLSAAVAGLSVGLERATNGGADQAETIDRGDLADRLDKIGPTLAPLAGALREKSAEAFGALLQRDEEIPAIIHSVRNGLQTVMMQTSILQQQLAKLKAAKDAVHGAALPEGNLDVLDAEIWSMARNLATWSREIGESLVSRV